MDDATTGKEFMGRGWRFPIAIDAEQGRIAFVEHEEDIEQSIRIILATSPGERVMRPTFGCGIHDLVFASISTALITRVKKVVFDALNAFEPRIDILNVDVDAAQVTNGFLNIILDYRNRTTNQSGNMVYPFYFREVA